MGGFPVTEEVTKLWGETLAAVSHLVPRPSYETWLRGTSPVQLEGEVLVLGVDSPAARQMMEKSYIGLIQEKAQEVFQRPLSIRLVSHDATAPAASTAPASSRPRAQGQETFSRGTTVNPRYTFEGFVIGGSNRFAHAASYAVAETPAKAYNPLFLYGGVGLGKTHLMNAIGNQIALGHPKLRVVYVSAESFTNDLINSIRDDKMAAFRNRFRNIDVLLIDDIQFLSGKERTQEEFFHTFEALHGASKQLVISSDRLPKDIPTLEERLRSRFEWGLIADMQPPDFDTRVAILRKKAQSDQLDVPSDVLSFIASKIDSNIRELEGALIRLVAFLSLHDEPCTVAMADRVLRSILPKPKLLTVRLIQEEVARRYRVPLADLTGTSRSRSVSLPRQVAMYLCRSLTDTSLPRLGEAFGGRDHSTIMHGCARVKDQMAADPSFRAAVESLGDSLRP